MQIFSARHVLPIDRPVLSPGSVAVDGGRIVAVGKPSELRGEAGPRMEVDLGDAILLPGLVNAHTHLELSVLGEDPPPWGDYESWLRGLLEQRKGVDAEAETRAAERAIATIVARGTVAIGEITNGLGTVAPLARSSLCGVVFLEVFGFRPSEAASIVERATSRVEEARGALGEGWTIAVTPHAPHTCSEALLKLLARRDRPRPLSIHVAESALETDYLRGSGALVDLLRERGQHDPLRVAPGCSPVELLARSSLLGERTLCVHAIRIDDEDIATLRRSGATVITCPRSNRALSVGRAPLEALDQAGVPWALGTDSLASSPDLDLFGEIAAVRDEHPAISPETVIRAATLGGATALGLADRLGRLAPGQDARFVIVPLDSASEDPYERLCGVPPEVRPVDARVGPGSSP